MKYTSIQTPILYSGGWLGATMIKTLSQKFQPMKYSWIEHRHWIEYRHLFYKVVRGGVYD